MPSIPVIVCMLAAGLTSFSRVFDATRPGWGRLPAWLQTLAPSLLMASGAIVAGLAHVVTGTDLAVVIVGGIFLAFPGAPSNRSAAPMQIGKAVTGNPSHGDVAVAAALKVGSVSLPPPPKGPSAPPLAAAMLSLLSVFAITAGLATCLLLSGCTWLESTAWPTVEHCAPTPATLLSQAEAILLAGGDYETKLTELAEQLGTDGKSLVQCAVMAFLDGRAPSTAAEATAKARGRAFLAKVHR